MQLPETVETLLRGAAVPHEPVSAVTLPDRLQAGSVRSVILQDAHGRTQALVGADRLLDLAALNRFAGREFGAAPDEANVGLCAARGLLALPAVPGALELPVIVDRDLLERPELLLESGGDGALVRLDGAAFRRLLEGCGAATADFAVPLEELLAPQPEPFAEVDAAEIGNAVAKFTTRRIHKRLEDTLDFPPLPEIAQRIIQLGADPNASTRELAKLVEMDPSLSAQVVSWASSPYYAAPGRISSIQDAIVRVLGFDLVMNLALGLALGKTLRLPREGRYGYRSYWLQAVHGAAMVEGLCRAMPAAKRPGIGHAYLGGLLHNFGFLILAELFKPQLQMVCRYTEANPHVGHWAVERFLLGVTREQMSAWLMGFWHLPEEVCVALRHQQQPERAGEHQPLATLLHVSSRLLRQQGIGSAPVERIPEARYADLGISRDDALGVSERILRSGDDLKALARSLAA